MLLTILSHLYAYYILHKATILVSLGVFYVLAAGTQPPLGSRPPSGYWKTWGYNLFQSGAANFSARFHPTIYSDPHAPSIPNTNQSEGK